MSPFLHVHHESSCLHIDARDVIQSGRHPLQEIVKLIEKAPSGMVCEIHVQDVVDDLVKALESIGYEVTVAKVTGEHVTLRVLKL